MDFGRTSTRLAAAARRPIEAITNVVDQLDRWGATDDEVASTMPGDELIAEPGMNATRSITLGSAPDDVFGWLAQMGFGRAGWYSYDVLDNLARPSARRLHPEWQVTEAGQSVPGGPLAFTAVVVVRPDAFVLALLDQTAPGHRVDFTLAYRLHAVGSGTRLVTRARACIDGPASGVATAGLTIGDGLMVRRQLLGLAERCGDRCG